MFNKIVACVLFTLAIASIPQSANALPTLNVSGGQLLGASNVDVGGVLYSVTFKEGTFEDIFGSATGLDFTTEAAADAASQALLDTVLVDNSGLGFFDSSPYTTFGISDLFEAYVLTPWVYYLSIVNGDNVVSSAAYNSFMNSDDGLKGVGTWVVWDSSLTGYDEYVYADWELMPAPVPEPSTFLLLGGGLLGLGWYGRKRKKA